MLTGIQISSEDQEADIINKGLWQDIGVKVQKRISDGNQK
jgi:hypothetical protein